MTEEDLAGRLARALEGLVPGREDAFAPLEELYAYDMVFKDPIQEIHGLSDFLTMNRRLLGRMKSLTWDIHLVATAGEVVLLEWTMRGQPRFGPRVRVEGMTRAKTQGGTIVDHRDYWDLGELGASMVPGGQRVLGALLKPFA